MPIWLEHKMSYKIKKWTEVIQCSRQYKHTSDCCCEKQLGYKHKKNGRNNSPLKLSCINYSPRATLNSCLFMHPQWMKKKWRMNCNSNRNSLFTLEKNCLQIQGNTGWVINIQRIILRGNYTFRLHGAIRSTRFLNRTGRTQTFLE